MPTVHLSLPEKMHRDLKYYAQLMGVQVTDLIKFFIKQGLEELYEKHGVPGTRDLEERINNVLSELMELKQRLLYMELYIKQQDAKINEVYQVLSEKIEELDLSIREIKEPVAEPELVDIRGGKRKIAYR